MPIFIRLLKFYLVFNNLIGGIRKCIISFNSDERELLTKMERLSICLSFVKMDFQVWIMLKDDSTKRIIKKKYSNTCLTIFFYLIESFKVYLCK